VELSQYTGYRERAAISIEEFFAMSDDQLFSKINSNRLHILQQFMPHRLNYSLRARPHNKTLIAKTTLTSQLNDQDFIIRSIYKVYYVQCIDCSICFTFVHMVAFVNLILKTRNILDCDQSNYSSRIILAHIPAKLLS